MQGRTTVKKYRLLIPHKGQTIAKKAGKRQTKRTSTKRWSKEGREAAYSEMRNEQRKVGEAEADPGERSMSRARVRAFSRMLIGRAITALCRCLLWAHFAVATWHNEGLPRYLLVNHRIVRRVRKVGRRDATKTRPNWRRQPHEWPTDVVYVLNKPQGRVCQVSKRWYRTV